MEPEVRPTQTPLGVAVDSVTRWSEEIQEIDRLCSIATMTLLVASRDKKGGFIGTLTSDGTRGAALGFRSTTTAQCVAALGAVSRFVDLLKLPTNSIKDDSNLPKALENEINKQWTNFSAGSADADILATLSSLVYGELNPLTCAHVLRALAPSLSLVEPAWIIALFAILWSLDRSVPSTDVAHGASLGDRRPTALATDKCVEAIELVGSVLQRRRERLAAVCHLIKELRDLEESEDQGAVPGSCWHDHQKRLAQQKLHGLLRESAQDVAVRELFERWFIALDDRLLHEMVSTTEMAVAFKQAVIDPDSISKLGLIKAQLRRGTEIIAKNYRKPISELAKYLGGACDNLSRSGIRDNRTTEVRELVAGVAKLERTIFDNWKELLVATLKKLDEAERTMKEHAGDGGEEFLAKMLVAIDPHCLDRRISVAHVDDTQQVFKRLEALIDRPPGPGPRDELQRDIDDLRDYWNDMQRSAEHAYQTCEVISDFVGNVLERYVQFGKGSDSSGAGLIRTLEDVCQELDDVLVEVRRRIEPTLTWARSKMARQLADAMSGAVSSFDPAELAYAARTCLRFKQVLDLDVIFKTVETVCLSQRRDGSWPAQRPFVWGERGFAAYPQSIDVALALVSTIRELVRVSERFGVTEEEIIRRAASMDTALHRARDALSQSVHSVPLPFRDALSPAQWRPALSVSGWCYDRIMEPGRIDIPVTATVLEFLVKLREYLQYRINVTIRSVFQSYAPENLPGIDGKLIPTDLEKGYEERITARIIDRVADVRFGAARRHYLPLSYSVEPKIDMWSAIFYGPPGSSKTYLAKTIAHELDWPIVLLSPSDFLAQGEGYVEKHATGIFELLSKGSELIYFLDEVDELILAREYQQKESQRSVFSFLTPSFLTKLQDLHDIARKQMYMFFIGTNYFERIDPAARRRGRIDEVFAVLYPDFSSREAIAWTSKTLQGAFANARPGGSALPEAVKAHVIRELARATELHSYNGIAALCEWIAAKCEGRWSDQTECVDEIREALGQIDCSENKKFRPEIDFSVYHGRLAAYEELFQMLKLIREDRRTTALLGVFRSCSQKERERFKDVIMHSVEADKFSDPDMIRRVLKGTAD